MGTNRGTINAIERVIALADELHAWMKVLKAHKGQQKRQESWTDDRYYYDARRKVVRYR